MPINQREIDQANRITDLEKRVAKLEKAKPKAAKKATQKAAEPKSDSK